VNLNIYKLYRLNIFKFGSYLQENTSSFPFKSQFLNDVHSFFGKQTKSTNKLQWYNVVLFNLKACRHLSTTPYKG